VSALTSVPRAAQVLGITPEEVLELCRTGELPSGVIEGVTVVQEAALYAYAERRPANA
jgi:hypothetical protein